MTAQGLAGCFRQVLAEHEHGALGGVDLAEALAQAALRSVSAPPGEAEYALPESLRGAMNYWAENARDPAIRMDCAAARDALAAAQPVLDPETVAEVVEGASMEWQLKFDQYRSETGDDPGPKADYIARALCEAAKRGALS